MCQGGECFVLLCSKFWCRNRPGDEMDKSTFGVNALVMGEEDNEGKHCVCVQFSCKGSTVDP